MHTIKIVLHETLTFTYPTDKVLSNFFRNNKQLSAYERNFIAETIYSLLRNYFKITQVVNKKNMLELIGITWVKIMHIDNAQLKNVTCIDFATIFQIEFNQDLASITELPQWVTDRIIKTYGEKEAIQLAKSMQETAPLDLRINLIKTNIKKVSSILEQGQISYSLTQFSPYALRLQNKTFLAKHKLFIEGMVEVQDESSQVAGLLLHPKRGEMIVDFCAGSGGKTLLFGMLMRNSGRIYAFDTNEKRLNNLTPRLARSGLSNVHAQLINNENDIKIKRLENKIDRVFVDAPCTGLGTLRRNPDLKLRQTDHNLDELNKKQLSILTSASKLVKAGGYIVYATCSILKCENQDIVNSFLATNNNFKLVPVNAILKNTKLTHEDGCLVLLPHIHHTDGFFAALLQKIK